MGLFDVALAWHQAGASVVPAATDGSKAPAVAWKPYETRRADPAQLATWFADNRYDGLGLVCGAISGNLEMFEVEGRGISLTADLAQLFANHDQAGLWARLNRGYLEITPSGGLHWLFHVDGPARGNLKLARRPATDEELATKPTEKIKVLAETRGEGGFVVVAPSNGRTHPTGKPWTVIAGGVHSIPTLTVDERDTLHALASMLDQMPADKAPDTIPASTPGKIDSEAGRRPGDDYNTRTDWQDILGPAGWTRVRTIGHGYGWRRPGKDRGISATTGTSSDGVDRLYVFSTSTDFEIETPYTKFGAHTLLNYGGNFSAAAADLRRAGYGADRTLRLVGDDPSNLITKPGKVQVETDGSAALLPMPAQRPKDAGHTDVGNADLLITKYGTEIRYVPERGQWLRWGGSRWIWDDAGTVIELAKTTILAIDTSGDPAVFKHQHRSLSRRAIEAMVALARTAAEVVVSAADLDRDPHALCTPNGVIDLRTGKIQDADPADLHTRSTSVPANPDAATPRWDRFLRETFADDQELTAFVQRLAGYSTTGVVGHHVLPFLHGPGGNGKSVFLDVLRGVLGDYATSAPAKFLMAGQTQHETEVARLAGTRLVICSEVNQDDRFDEAKVKLLTGGDALTARFMRENHFTFRPTHHLWLMGNHQPKVSGGGQAFWRRLRMIEFTQQVPAENRVEGLADILATEEGPGILAWLVTGAVAALADGLAEPAVVLNATSTYADEEDALARFIADRCHLGGGSQVRLETKELRRAYEEWCRDEGDRPVSPQVFGRELRNRFGISVGRSNGKKYYLGTTLLTEDGDEQQPHWSDR